MRIDGMSLDEVLAAFGDYRIVFLGKYDYEVQFSLAELFSLIKEAVKRGDE